MWKCDGRIDRFYWAKIILMVCYIFDMIFGKEYVGQYGGCVCQYCMSYKIEICMIWRMCMEYVHISNIKRVYAYFHACMEKYTSIV